MDALYGKPRGKNSHEIIPPVVPEKIHHGTREAEKAIWEALNFLKSNWNFSGSEIARLIHLPPTTVNGWLSAKRIPIGKPPFSPDAEALLNLIAIHRSLYAMFSKKENQVAWLQTSHPEIGVAPLSRMKESLTGLIFVRQYLDYIRGRGA